MGLSVPIASGIMLIAFTISASMLLQTMIVQTQTLSKAIDEYVAGEADRLGVTLELNITSINASDGKVNLTLRNTGSKTIFLLQNKTLEFRSDVIVAYNGSAATWISQSIDHYDVLEVKVVNTGVVLDPTSHPYLNPGEEALIQISVDGLESGSILVVVFVSHYGVTAQAEGVAP